VKSRWLLTSSVRLLAAASLAGLVVGTAACNVTSPGGAPASPSPSAAASADAGDAKEALSKAAMELGKTSYQVDVVAGPVSSKGAMDPVGQQGTMTTTLFTGSANATLETTLIGADMWLKITGLPAVPNKWLHLDTAKLPEDSALGIRPGKLDPANTDRMIESITTIERAGASGYRGTLDLTKASTSAIIDKATVDTLGDRAKAVPFTAMVDAQGRLTNFTMDLGMVEGVPVKVNVTYRDFGAKVSPTRPAATDVVEAPDAVYQLLGA